MEVNSISIKSEDVLLNALNHKIRREILELLVSTDLAYTSILEHFDITTGKLNYHLKLLEGLVEKSATNWYQLTPLGKKTIGLLHNFQNQLSDTDQSLIKKAYLSQQTTQPSFLHLMFVSRMKFKFWLLVAVSLALVISAIIYLSVGGEIIVILPMLIVGAVVGIGGIVWIALLRKSAPEFVSKVDKVIHKLDDTQQ